MGASRGVEPSAVCVGLHLPAGVRERADSTSDGSKLEWNVNVTLKRERNGKGRGRAEI